MAKKIMTLTEFYDGCDAGERDFTGVKLLNPELIRFHDIPTGIILKKAYLNGANLEEIGIHAVDLSYAKLRKTRLGETWFVETNLEGADFRGANFCETSFYKCNLRRANFSETDVRAILFRNVDLSYASFRGVSDFGTLLFDRVIFHETIMPDGSITSDNPRDNC
jgi:uncharacterized protein YjbI with pentapeptide repeats